MNKTHTRDFATMLRGIAGRLERGELFLVGSQHEQHTDPLASSFVAFTVSPVRTVEADQPAPTETGPKLDTSLMTEDGKRVWEAAQLAETAPQGALPFVERCDHSWREESGYRYCWKCGANIDPSAGEVVK